MEVNEQLSPTIFFLLEKNKWTEHNCWSVLKHNINIKSVNEGKDMSAVINKSSEGMMDMDKGGMDMPMMQVWLFDSFFIVLLNSKTMLYLSEITRLSHFSLFVPSPSTIQRVGPKMWSEIIVSRCNSSKNSKEAFHVFLSSFAFLHPLETW